MMKLVGDKKRWRQYRARAQALPEPYRASIDAIERYLMYTGVDDGDSLMRMLEDLADLLEQAHADGTPIRSVVGVDPVEFAEAFKENYGLGQWLSRERQRLVDAIDRAESGAQPSR